MILKAITLWQPWASLLAGGPKVYETRSWKTNHRGWIAIHAAARFDRIVTDACQEFKEELAEMGILNWQSVIATGAVVGVGKLKGIIKCRGPLATQHLIPDFHEVAPYGDYSKGRYAWVFSEMIPVYPPIPATGGQRIWNWNAPGKIQLLIGQLDNL